MPDICSSTRDIPIDRKPPQAEEHETPLAAGRTRVDIRQGCWDRILPATTSRVVLSLFGGPCGADAPQAGREYGSPSSVVNNQRTDALCQISYPIVGIKSSQKLARTPDLYDPALWDPCMAPDFLLAEIESRFGRVSSSASGPARSAIVAGQGALVDRHTFQSQVEFWAESSWQIGCGRADFLCDSVTSCSGTI